MRVGSIEETITVTSEAPVVDVRSSTRQQVLDSDMIAALPSARSYVTLGRLIPGTVGTGQASNDVGGSQLQDVGGSLMIHGSRAVDQRVTLNGINTMTLQAGGNIGGQIPDVGSANEVTVDTSSLSADMPTGGVRINFIPRDGGNAFHNSTFLTFSNRALQGSNFSEELRAAGLPTPNRVIKNWDFSEALGGPIRRDRALVLVLGPLQRRRERGAGLREPQRLQPDAVVLRAGYGDPRRQRRTRACRAACA